MLHASTEQELLFFVSSKNLYSCRLNKLSELPIYPNNNRHSPGSSYLRIFGHNYLRRGGDLLIVGSWGSVGARNGGTSKRNTALNTCSYFDGFTLEIILYT